MTPSHIISFLTKVAQVCAYERLKQMAGILRTEIAQAFRPSSLLAALYDRSVEGTTALSRQLFGPCVLLIPVSDLPMKVPVIDANYP